MTEVKHKRHCNERSINRCSNEFVQNLGRRSWKARWECRSIISLIISSCWTRTNDGQIWIRNNCVNNRTFRSYRYSLKERKFLDAKKMMKFHRRWSYGVVWVCEINARSDSSCSINCSACHCCLERTMKINTRKTNRLQWIIIYFLSFW